MKLTSSKEEREIRRKILIHDLFLAVDNCTCVFQLACLRMVDVDCVGLLDRECINLNAHGDRSGMFYAVSEASKFVISPNWKKELDALIEKRMLVITKI